MMKLNNKSITQKDLWINAGIELPEFDPEKMGKKTFENPIWVHFGGGNIFRGFIALLQHTLLNSGDADRGIVAVETYDCEIIHKIYRPYDNLSLLVLMEPDGSLKKKVVGSVCESLIGDIKEEKDWKRLHEIFTKPSLQMVSFTITEKGYSLINMSKEYLPNALQDMEKGPHCTTHIIGKIASLVYKRFLSGQHPIALVSMDNCSHNGDVLKNSIETIVKAWVEKGYVEKEFLEYLNNPQKVTFPLTMIDKITPRPSEKIKEELEGIGFESTEIICTDKKTFIAPFVNAEITQYLIVEDLFPNGRMPLEKAGVIFTDRKTVDQVEKMKVGTCLNPLHTALAVFGCLLGYNLISHEMKDTSLKKLIELIGFGEGMPVVTDPEIISPGDFIREVIEVRLPNPFMPDSPQRIVSDTSQKMPVRFGETLKAYCGSDKLDVKSLKGIPLVIAGWCRYLLGIDDRGEKMELSPDPMLDQLKDYLKDIRYKDTNSVGDKLKPILSNEKLFGLNLYNIGLGDRIEEYFKEMIEKDGAVRLVLEKYL